MSISTRPGPGVGVSVGVLVGVDVEVSVGVDVEVSVGVDVEVSVGVDVEVSVGVGVEVSVGVGVEVSVGVGVEVSVGVGVEVSVGVGVEVSVDVGVEVSVGVAGGAQPAAETRLESKVTAPVRAMARPVKLTPVVSVLLARARILPTNVVPVPSVAELPTCQKTLQAEAPLIRRTDEALAVVSVLPI